MVNLTGRYKLDYSLRDGKPKILSMTEKNLQKISNLGAEMKETLLLNPNSLLGSDENIFAVNQQRKKINFTGKIKNDSSMLHSKSELHIQSSIVSLNTQGRQVLKENSKLTKNIYNLLGGQVESPNLQSINTNTGSLLKKNPGFPKQNLQKREPNKISESCLHLSPTLSNPRPQKRQGSFSHRGSGLEALLPAKTNPSDETKYYQNLASILSPVNSQRHQN
jgi:hypothetical protein